MKRCSKCGVEKDEEEFNKDNSKKDGLRSWCRPCTRARQKVWEARNKERRAGYFKAYRAKNKDTLAANDKKWLSQNPMRYARRNAISNLRAALGFTPPEELVEVKAWQYLIKRTIKEMTE